MSLLKKIIIIFIFLISYFLGTKDSKANLLQSNTNDYSKNSAYTLNNCYTFSNLNIISIN